MSKNTNTLKLKCLHLTPHTTNPYYNEPKSLILRMYLPENTEMNTAVVECSPSKLGLYLLELNKNVS